jgi:hypothetical protein
MNPINPNNQLEHVKKVVKVFSLPEKRKETVAVWPELKMNADWKPVPRPKKLYGREATIVTIEDVSNGKL